jgi:transcriptional regulator with XRE-family HTH domain
VTRELTPEEQNRLRRYREQIASELPDLAERDRMRKEARDEATLSGELRRAIHASPLSLAAIAERAGISPLALDEFLTGERTLRSDVLDRLAGILGYVLQPTQ